MLPQHLLRKLQQNKLQKEEIQHNRFCKLLHKLFKIKIVKQLWLYVRHLFRWFKAVHLRKPQLDKNQFIEKADDFLIGKISN
jgi:hypothetical protein